ncbi:MAG: hypothetical protein V1907_00995 [Candidatus Kerfeldbacteria bacterium]
MLKQLLVLLAALTLVSMAHAGTITEVATVDTGQVIYYGHGPIAAPFVFGTDGTDTFVRFQSDSSFAMAGLDWVPWRLDTSSTSHRSIQYIPVLGTLDAVFEDARAAVDTEGLHGMARATRLAELYRKSNLIDSAKVIMSEQEGPKVGIYPKNGLPILGAVDETPRNLSPETPMERARNDIARIVSSLQSGRLVIVDHGIECSVAPNAIADVTDELRALRSGRRPCRIKNAEIIRRFQQGQPIPLSKLVRGRD